MDFIATNTVYQTPLYLKHPKLFKKNIQVDLFCKVRGEWRFGIVGHKMTMDGFTPHRLYKYISFN